MTRAAMISLLIGCGSSASRPAQTPEAKVEPAAKAACTPQRLAEGIRTLARDNADGYLKGDHMRVACRPRPDAKVEIEMTCASGESEPTGEAVSSLGKRAIKSGNHLVVWDDDSSCRFDVEGDGDLTDYARAVIALIP